MNIKPSINDLKEFVIKVLVAKRVPVNVAQDVATVMIAAQAKGFGSHGLIRLGRILTGIDAGTHFPDAEPKFHNTGSAAIWVDGQHQLGPHVALELTRKLIKVAGKTGIAVGSARNMTHFGIGGYYSAMMAEAGLAGLVLCNTQPAASPFSGKGKVLGTNPISFSCKRSSGEILTVDMATTAAARGKLLAAELAGEPLDDYLAVDKDGVMTNDPAAGLAGSLLPLGGQFGYKGTGLAFLVDILSGALSGAETGKRVKGTATTTDLCTSGYFMLAINPNMFIGREGFENQIDQLASEMKNSGKEVLLPGERECVIEAAAMRDGIEIPSALAGELGKWAKECNVEYPF